MTSNYDKYGCEIDGSPKRETSVTRNNNSKERAVQENENRIQDHFMMVRDYSNFSSSRSESKELDDEVGVPSSEKVLLELVVSIDDREQTKGMDVANAVACNYGNLGKGNHMQIGDCFVGDPT